MDAGLAAVSDLLSLTWTSDKLWSVSPAKLTPLYFTGAATLCSPAHCRSPEDLGLSLHILAAFPAPSPLLLFKAVSVRRVSPPGQPTRPQEPRRTDVTAWLVSCCVLGVWAQPPGARTCRELWGLDFFMLFSIFLYTIRSCTYSTTALTRADMSCHAMLSSLLLPQKPHPAAISSNRTTMSFVCVCFGQPGLWNTNANISPPFLPSQQAQLKSSLNRLHLWKSGDWCTLLCFSPKTTSFLPPIPRHFCLDTSELQAELDSLRQWLQVMKWYLHPIIVLFDTWWLGSCHCLLLSLCQMTEPSVSPVPSGPASACIRHCESLRWHFPFSSASISSFCCAFPSLGSAFLTVCICHRGLPLPPVANYVSTNPAVSKPQRCRTCNGAFCTYRDYYKLLVKYLTVLGCAEG